MWWILLALKTLSLKSVIHLGESSSDRDLFWTWIMIMAFLTGKI